MPFHPERHAIIDWPQFPLPQLIYTEMIGVMRPVMAECGTQFRLELHAFGFRTGIAEQHGTQTTDKTSPIRCQPFDRKGMPPTTPAEPFAHAIVGVEVFEGGRLLVQELQYPDACQSTTS